MKNFLDAVVSAVGQSNVYASLGLALALPDICGSLAQPKLGHGQRYRVWWGEFMPAYETFLPPSDAWLLRCAFLHGGVDIIDGAPAYRVLDRVRFGLTAEGRPSHKVRIDGLLILEASIFCLEIVDGVHRWLAAVEGDADIAARILNLMAVHDYAKEGYLRVGGAAIGPSNSVW